MLKNKERVNTQNSESEGEGLRHEKKGTRIRV